MSNMHINVVFDKEEIQKYMDEYAQSIIKTEIAKHVKAQWEHWSNQYEFKQQIKVLLSERLQEEVRGFWQITRALNSVLKPRSIAQSQRESPILLRNWRKYEPT